jgi:hypothetical protein
MWHDSLQEIFINAAYFSLLIFVLMAGRVGADMFWRRFEKNNKDCEGKTNGCAACKLKDGCDKI